MRGSILECSDLLAMTGYDRPGDAARSLRRQGIHVFEGKDGIWTTLELVNKAGGIVPVTAPANDTYRPEDVL